MAVHALPPNSIADAEAPAGAAPGRWVRRLVDRVSVRRIIGPHDRPP